MALPPTDVVGELAGAPAGAPIDPEHVDGSEVGEDGEPVGEGRRPPAGRRTPAAAGQRRGGQRRGGGRRAARRGGGRRGGGGGSRSAGRGSGGQPGEGNPIAELFKALMGGRMGRLSKEDLAGLSPEQIAALQREGYLSPQELAEATADKVPGAPGATPVADAGRVTTDPTLNAAWQTASFQADNLGFGSGQFPWQTADAGSLGGFPTQFGGPGMGFGGPSMGGFSGASVFGMG